jgi:hypothetical protein
MAVIARLSLAVALVIVPWAASATQIVSKCEGAQGMFFSKHPCPAGMQESHYYANDNGTIEGPAPDNPAYVAPNVPQAPTSDRPGASAGAQPNGGPSLVDQIRADEQARQRHRSEVRKVLLGHIVQLLTYAFVAALIGWWAAYRNRSFWNWFLLSMVFTPGLTFWFFLFRGRDPV